MADAGKIVITPKGAYSSTKTYEWLDEVSYNGNAYVALKTVTGVTPSDDGVNWRLFMSSTDVDANVLVPKFTEASTRSNIVSGENLSTMFGKIKKWFTDLKSHAFKDLVNNLTTSTTGSALDASQGKILKDEVDGVNRNLDNLSYNDYAGGKNLIDKNKCIINKVINYLNGLEITQYGASCTDYICVEADTTYTKINCATGQENWYYDIDKNPITYIPANKDTFTTPSNAYFVRLTISTSVLDKAQLEKGSTATEYEPYIPSVKMIADEVSTQNESLSVLGKCKNLLNPTLQNTTQNGITCTTNGDGTYTLNGTATQNTFFTVGDINYKENKIYKLIGCPLGGHYNNGYSLYTDYTDSDTGLKKVIDSGTGSTVFTPVADVQGFVFIAIRKDCTCNNVVFKPMIVDASKTPNATYGDFMPYTGDGDTLTHDVANIKNDLGEQKKIYSESTINVGRQAGTTVGDNSTAEGTDTEASGESSHAEGSETTASGEASHAEGEMVTASATASHAEGYKTKASGLYSHAEGYCTKALDNYTHAEGNNTKAQASAAHAEGTGTVALRNQHAQGHYNNTTTATGNSGAGTSTGTAFVIGNGTSESAANAFRVTGEGKIYASSETINVGADYAEYFEWSDENVNSEDRVGKFVTFDENNPEKIRFANADDYILGIVSGMPSVIGNGDECWKKRYILDDFGRYIVENFEYDVKTIDPESGKEITETEIGTKWKENPDYDGTKEYIPRAERPEWSAIGMVGVLSVYDDGSCKVNGYCKVADGGIATEAEKGDGTYRVIKRVNENIVKIVLK